MKNLLKLLITFLKIGTFTFGGGYAMIPAIRRETVDARHWVTEQEIADYIAICQSLPGAFAVNVAVAIGKKVKGVPGALIAVFGLIFPAFLSILIILLFLGRIEDNPYVQGAFRGIMAASVALILVTAYQLARSILKRFISYAVAAMAFILIILLDVNAIWAILIGGLTGFLEYLWRIRTVSKKKEGS